MTYMFEYSNEVLEQGLPLFVGNYSSSEVAKYVWTACLNCVQITVRNRMISLKKEHYMYFYSLCLVEEQVNDVILPLGVVEEDKQTPVD